MSANTLAKLQGLADDEIVSPFGPYQEEAIISLSLDHPEFFTSIARFITPDMFVSLEARLIIAEILNSFEEHSVVLSRKMLRDKIIRSLTEDDPWQKILEIIDKESDPREVPIIKDTLLKWAKDRAYGLIYGEEAQDAYARGDYEHLESLVNQANRIADVGQQGFWFLENYQALYEPDIIDHRTTGFPQLDRLLNNGGPSTKEVVCWLAATNVGKCHTLQSKILERNLSNIFKIEMEDGSVIELAGFREVQTTRGMVKVCDLTDEDEITEAPIETDGNVELSDLRICDGKVITSKHNDDAST